MDNKQRFFHALQKIFEIKKLSSDHNQLLPHSNEEFKSFDPSMKSTVHMQLASLFDSLSKTQIIYFSTICKTKTIIIFDIRRYQKKNTTN